MHARVVTFNGQPDGLQEDLRKLEESTPRLRTNPGFQDIYCLIDRNGGNCVVVALWESEPALQHAADVVKSVRDEVTRAFGATQEPKIDVYEVGCGPGKMMSRPAQPILAEELDIFNVRSKAA